MIAEGRGQEKPTETRTKTDPSRWHGRQWETDKAHCQPNIKSIIETELTTAQMREGLSRVIKLIDQCHCIWIAITSKANGPQPKRKRVLI
jgi:hypothetical protein